MRIAPLMAGAILSLGMAAFTGPAEAAAPGVPSGIVKSQSQSLVEQVHYRRWDRRHHHWRHGHRARWGHCSRVRNICANRYGWGGHRFRRCVIGRGC